MNGVSAGRAQHNKHAAPKMGLDNAGQRNGKRTSARAAGVLLVGSGKRDRGSSGKILYADADGKARLAAAKQSCVAGVPLPHEQMTDQPPCLPECCAAVTREDKHALSGRKEDGRPSACVSRRCAGAALSRPARSEQSKLAM